MTVIRYEPWGLLNRLRQSEDGQEGLNAFLQKRPPRWTKEYKI